MGSDDHVFGGAWTEKKLQVLKEYLNAYTTILKHQNFSLVYIDAFAGDGDGARAEIIPEAPLFEEPEKTIYFPGSASIALETTPNFHYYLLIDSNRTRFQKLEELAVEYKKKRSLQVEARCGEAGVELENFIAEINRGKFGGPKKVRGVIFLDPYGFEVSCDTLKMIQKTELFDVWYLFPTFGVVRQLPHNHDSLDKKRGNLSRGCLDPLIGKIGFMLKFYRIRR